MSLLNQIVRSDSARQVQSGQVVEPTRRRRWAKPKRRSRQDRIAAEQRLGDELRQRRQEREARWQAEELARQAYELPEGIEPVRIQDGAAR